MTTTGRSIDRSIATTTDRGDGDGRSRAIRLRARSSSSRTRRGREAPTLVASIRSSFVPVWIEKYLSVPPRGASSSILFSIGRGSSLAFVADRVGVDARTRETDGATSWVRVGARAKGSTRGAREETRAKEGRRARRDEGEGGKIVIRRRMSKRDVRLTILFFCVSCDCSA